MQTMREIMQQLTSTEALTARYKEMYIVTDDQALELAASFQKAISAPSRRQMEKLIREYRHQLAAYKEKNPPKDALEELAEWEPPEWDIPEIDFADPFI